MLRRPQPRLAPAGFSLLEVSIATVIFAIALSIVWAILHSSMTTVEIGTIQADLQANADAVLEQMARELKDSGITCTGWNLPTATSTNWSISFSRLTGLSVDPTTYALTRTWGPVITYQVLAGPTLNGWQTYYLKKSWTDSGGVLRTQTLSDQLYMPQKIFPTDPTPTPLVAVTASNEAIQFNCFDIRVLSSGSQRGNHQLGAGKTKALDDGEH